MNNVGDSLGCSLRGTLVAKVTESTQHAPAAVSSQFKGVHWHSQHKKWVAGLTSAGKYHYLGGFDDEAEAGFR